MLLTLVEGAGLELWTASVEARASTVLAQSSGHYEEPLIPETRTPPHSATWDVLPGLDWTYLQEDEQADLP